MLVFVVSIVYAVGRSGYGDQDPSKDDAYYSIYLWNVMYTAATTTTSNEHSIYLDNGEEHNIDYEYEFKHVLKDIGGYENTLIGGGELSDGETFYKYSKQTMSVFGAPQGQHTLSCYTRVGFERRNNPSTGDQVDDEEIFNR